MTEIGVAPPVHCHEVADVMCNTPGLKLSPECHQTTLVTIFNHTL